jgi:glycosyltransferase involved in cell wall biosynthesis
MKNIPLPARLKILYLITGLRLGGAERQLLLLAESMRTMGHEVVVVAMESGGTMAANFIRKSIALREIDIKGAGTLLPGYFRLKKIVSEYSPDIIHSHMIHANLLGRIFKLFNPRYRHISTAHNIKEGSRMLMKGYSWTKGISNWSTNVSREALHEYVEKGYFDPARSSCIPNGIDTGEFRPDGGVKLKLRAELGIANHSYVFFSAGRLHEQKDHQLLLGAFKVISDQFAGTILVIAGEGPLDADLKSFSTHLGIAGKTFFLGRRADIPSLLNMSDCFVLSSKYEGFGLVIAEALATMKPVIATDCGGVSEVMADYGTLVKPGDLQAMSAAMAFEMQHPSPTELLLNGRRHIEEHYAIDAVATQWLNLYHKL